MRIKAILNQKGGVGKTTTSVNLAAALAQLGHRVLLVDMDPQGNASTHLGVDVHQLEASMYDVLTGKAKMHEVVHPTGHASLFCTPSNIDLSGAEIEMVSAVGRETILQEALTELQAHETGGFDHVLIDCPPSLGLLCVNALAAADELIIPMQTEFFALQGMGKLMEVIELIRRRINPSLEIAGIVACRMDTRTRLALEVLDDIEANLPNLLWKTRIRQNVKLAEAPSFGQTIFEYAGDSNGAQDYRRLAVEYLGGDLQAYDAVLEGASEAERTDDEPTAEANEDDPPPAAESKSKDEWRAIVERGEARLAERHGAAE